MSLNRTTLEVIAPSIEEAIQKGLAELGMPLDSVEVETLDEGSRGLFGLGSRQARVRLTVKDLNTQVDRNNEEAWLEAPETKIPDREAVPAVAATTAALRRQVDAESQLEISKVIVTELLEKMNVRATVTTHFGDVDEKERIPILVDVEGDDLGILIGRRAETLNALQYIANLIVSKELGHGVTLVVDVEGYRQRREEQVRRLARRMADQAVKTGRRQVLEPMPANERRFIHMELRDHPDVKTESSGEEPHRKVNIIPR